MEETTLRLSRPVTLKLELPDGSGDCRIDVFAARRMLAEAEKQPTEEQRWQFVLNWLAAKLQVGPHLLAESTALEFHDAICKLVQEAISVRSKKLDSIASSLTSTQESPTTSELGP